MNITKEGDEFAGAFNDKSFISKMEKVAPESNTCELDNGECENCGS